MNAQRVEMAAALIWLPNEKTVPCVSWYPPPLDKLLESKMKKVITMKKANPITFVSVAIKLILPCSVIAADCYRMDSPKGQ